MNGVGPSSKVSATHLSTLQSGGRAAEVFDSVAHPLSSSETATTVRLRRSIGPVYGSAPGLISSSISVTSAAMGERSLRIRVMWANNG